VAQLDEWEEPDAPIPLTRHQRVIVETAIKKARELSKDDTLDESRCIELICVDFLESFEK
jgi:hypothetical protein